MALIGKIREKSWLLVIVIGVAMLAFVLGDLNPFGNGQMTDNYGIGTIDGQKVDDIKYNTFVNNAQNNILQSKYQENPFENPVLTKADRDNAEQQAWQTILAMTLLSKEYKKIGLVVDEIELENVLYGEEGYNPSSFSIQFTDSITGEFAPDQLRKALEGLYESGEADAMFQYEQIMDYVRNERLETKYQVLLQQGLHATSVEAKKEYTAQRDVKDVTYVYKGFTNVPVNAIAEPTEEEIKTYFNAHKQEKKYEQKANRKISYFTIPIQPSEDDTLNALAFLNELKPRFAATDNDSVFVMNFSEFKYFSSGKDGMVKPEGAMTQGPTYPKSIAGEIENGKIGDVVGPYLTYDGIKLSKIIGYEAEKTATVRHILLSATEPAAVELAQKKADSIIKVIRSKKNFEEMVRLFSEDPGSIETGGKYEDFTEGMMVTEFNDFSFQKPIGTLGSVKTSYGIHIVEVLDRKETEYPVLATVVKSADVTKTTADVINSMASGYIYDIDDMFSGKSLEKKVEVFDTFAIQNGYTIRTAVIFEDNPTVQGFSDIGEDKVLRLVFDPNVSAGDISSSPIRDQDRFVVAMITEINKDGVPSFETVKEQMKREVIKEKQGLYLVDEMVGKDNLESLSMEIGAQLQTESVTFSANNVAVGNEPKIVGTVFSGLRDGESSVPIVGENGVFVVRVNSTTLGEETTDFSDQKDQLKQQYRSSLNSQYSNGLIKKANIVDNRKLRSLGIR